MFWQENPTYLYFFETMPVLLKLLLKLILNFMGLVKTFVFESFECLMGLGIWCKVA